MQLEPLIAKALRDGSSLEDHPELNERHRLLWNARDAWQESIKREANGDRSVWGPRWDAVHKLAAEKAGEPVPGVDFKPLHATGH